MLSLQRYDEWILYLGLPYQRYFFAPNSKKTIKSERQTSIVNCVNEFWVQITCICYLVKSSGHKNEVDEREIQGERKDKRKIEVKSSTLV